MSDFVERLKLARERAGYPDAAAAIERLSLKSSTYYGHENGDRMPRNDTVREYAKMYNVPFDWLLNGGPEPSTEKVSIAQPVANASPPVPKGDLTRHGQLPVYGVAIGGPDGRFAFNGEVIDRLARPPILANVMNAYAVFVAGESMEPRYFAGEAVYVHPGRPVRKGNFVVVQLHPEEAGNPPQGFVKQFVAYTGSELVLNQFNPPGEIRFRREEVLSVHRIVFSGEDA